MPSVWPEFPLGDIAADVTVGHVGTMASRYVDAGVPFLRSQNVRRLRLDLTDVKFIPPDFHRQLSKSRLRPGDVVVVRTGEPGVCAVVPEELPDANCADLVIIRPGPRINARFLAYYVNEAAAHHVASHLVGAVQQHFNVGAARILPIRLPSIAEQEAIVEVLGSLDDKIEQNRRTGRALEGLARATFKAWFVDFEPVKAKAAGATSFPGMPASAFAALPNRLTDSPVGPVPQGWEVRRLDSVLTLHYGKSLPKTMRGSGEVPVYGSGGVTGTHSGALVNGPGIIVGRKGSVGTLYWENDGFYPIDTTYYVKPAAELGLHYLFELLRTLGLEDMNTDAAVPGLNRENAYRLEVPVPTAAVADCFEEYAITLRDMVSHLAAESSKLAALRDYLLPRLLSGRVRVRPSQAEAKG